MANATRDKPTAGEALLRPAAVARILDVSEDMVRRLSLTGGLPCHKIGGRRKYYESEVRARITLQLQVRTAEPERAEEPKPRPAEAGAAGFDFEAEVRGSRRNIGTVAGWLGCSKDTVRRRCAEGLPHRRFGNRYLFRASEVEDWIARGKAVQHAEPKRTPAAQEATASSRGGRRCSDAEVGATRRRKA